MGTRFFKDKEQGAVLVKAYCKGSCLDNVDMLEPNTVDAAREKHVPAVTVEGNLVHVTVGEVAHPMDPDHFITFICLQSKKGDQIFRLKPGDAPEATFALTDDDEPIAVFEYCNKHGLWKYAL